MPATSSTVLAVAHFSGYVVCMASSSGVVPSNAMTGDPCSFCLRTMARCPLGFS